MRRALYERDSKRRLAGAAIAFENETRRLSPPRFQAIYCAGM